ncbi:U3 small nucleolar ribonucleoprotein mpp10 [Termitomyces sp. T112]|nr:U3 small nucleolar ribonucleoprotein mpp10 [Termitomyces sp. T112]
MAIAIPHPQFSELQPLSDLVNANLECFAQGSEDIRSAALNAARFLFDLAVSSEKLSKPHITQLIASLEPSSAPQTRSQSIAKGKRKRTPSPPRLVVDSTPINSLFTEGMNDEQVWTQLDLRSKHICETLEHVLEGGPDRDEDVMEDDSSEDEFDDDERLNSMLKAMANGEDVDFNLPEGVDDPFFDEDDTRSSEGANNEEDEKDLDREDDLPEGVADLHDLSSDESDPELGSSSFSPKRKPRGRRSGKHSELDDAFFDLASFNAETEEAEAKSSSRGRLGEEEDSDDNISVDLFTALDEEEDSDDTEEGAGEAMYDDFFAPPRKTASAQHQLGSALKKSVQVRFHKEVRVKNIRAKGKNLPLYTKDEDEDEDDEDSEDQDVESEHDNVPHRRRNFDEDELEADVESSDISDDIEENIFDKSREAIERLKDDLFADEGDDTDKNDLSTHEKRMAELREQIAELESENVGPKDWVLMGEAGSRSRPQNSVLEEDLEFERATKAVPVVTEDTVRSLEERIKARISENRFDDVIRIRPLDDRPFLPSRVFELKDTKSAQSLAQIYEDEYVATRTGGAAGEDRDGKLKKEHEEIEKLWEGICHKLDALCNSYFMPKQPKAIISTVSNVSTATLESALPTTKSITTMLAPEEVFTPSVAGLRARSELTPVEKRALRGRERKARKKSRDALDKNVDKFARVKGIGSVKKQKKAALESVVKSGKGVTIVGKPKKELRKGQGNRST